MEVQDPILKRCTKCGAEKTLDSYTLHPKGKAGRNPSCRPCKAAQDARRYSSRPDKRAHNRRQRLRLKYGIDQAEAERLLASQDGKCPGCGRHISFVGEPTQVAAIDHDHKTGRIRGILCQSCNKALGMIADRPETLLALAHYLVGGFRMAIADNMR